MTLKLRNEPVGLDVSDVQFCKSTCRRRPRLHCRSLTWCRSCRQRGRAAFRRARTVPQRGASQQARLEGVNAGFICRRAPRNCGSSALAVDRRGSPRAAQLLAGTSLAQAARRHKSDPSLERANREPQNFCGNCIHRARPEFERRRLPGPPLMFEGLSGHGVATGGSLSRFWAIVKGLHVPSPSFQYLSPMFAKTLGFALVSSAVHPPYLLASPVAAVPEAGQEINWR